MTLIRPAVFAMLVLGFGCGPGSQLEPKQGSLFGHFAVEAEHPRLAALADPLRVEVGGVRAYAVERLAADRVRFVVQGAPQAGDAEVVVRSGQALEKVGTLRYLPPVHPRFERMVAFGASLTMGAQDASVSARSQLHGPAALLARAAGAHLGLPLLADGFVPGLTLEDFDPDTCAFRGTDIFEVIGARAMNELWPKLRDRSGNLVLSRLRVDPTLEARNVAIGGFRIGQALRGANDALGVGLEHVIWHPYPRPEEVPFDPPERMVDRVVALGPTLVVSTDLFGNDYNNLSLKGDGVPDLAALTSMDSFRPDLAEVLRRLEETGAEVFLATGPDVTHLPAYPRKVAALRAAGYDEAAATGWLGQLRARIGEYNAELYAQAAAYPRVHVVDLHAKVEEIFTAGADVGGVHLDAKPFGGLLSLDGMHFSDTGYALLANVFVAGMNDALGAKIPEVDADAAMRDDPYSIEALRAAGLSCAGR